MKYYAGIDIGGSRMKAVLLDGFRVPPRTRLMADTPGDKNRFLTVLNRIVESILPPKGLVGIGIGIPGIIDQRKGTVMQAPNLPFLDGWSVKPFFKKWKAPIRIDNDGNCFLNAETISGAGRGRANVVAVVIGTGIGGGIMIDRKIYRGSHGGAGEFGHMIFRVPENKKLVTDCQWERLAGKNSVLRQGNRNEILGVGVANLINAFDPDMIVVGGGGITSGAVKLRNVKIAVKKYSVLPMNRKVPIVPAQLGDYGPAIGAAMLYKL